MSTATQQTATPQQSKQPDITSTRQKKPPVTIPIIAFNISETESNAATAPLPLYHPPPHDPATLHVTSPSAMPQYPFPLASPPQHAAAVSQVPFPPGPGVPPNEQYQPQYQQPYMVVPPGANNNNNIPYMQDYCVMCGLFLFPETTVRLSCQHFLCFPCMIDHQAATKYQATTNCPDCHQPITRYQYCKKVWMGKFERNRQKKMEVVLQPCREYPARDPGQRLVTLKDGVDDIRKFMAKTNPESIGEHGVLCTSQVKVLVKDGKLKVKPLAFSALCLDPAAPPSYDFTKHFVVFHPVLRTLSTTSKFDSTPLTVDQLLEFIPTDPRPLVRAVLALATGHSSTNDFDIHNAYGQSYLLASYLACDLIQRAINPQKEMGPAIRTLTAATDAEASVSLRLLLSKFRVTQSCKNYYRNKQPKDGTTNQDEDDVLV